MSTIKKLLKSFIPKRLQTELVILKKRSEVLIANYYFQIQSRRSINYKQIPIIINNYNRLEYLRKLIFSLSTRGYTNIYILDNNSTYPPLLEYYKSCPYTVYRLNRNVGYKALWETNIYQQFRHSYYVYTDSDMEIDAECPPDFIEHFINVLRRYPTAQKVGFGIRIDDLPDTYIFKKDVIEWESQFWDKEVEPALFRASIDTTFAVYRPYCKGEVDSRQKVFRTGFPYLIRHLPWYGAMQNLEEESYYMQTIETSTHWSKKNKDYYGA